MYKYYTVFVVQKKPLISEDPKLSGGGGQDKYLVVLFKGNFSLLIISEFLAMANQPHYSTLIIWFCWTMKSLSRFYAIHTVSFDLIMSGLEWILNLEFCLLKLQVKNSSKSDRNQSKLTVCNVPALVSYGL